MDETVVAQSDTSSSQLMAALYVVLWFHVLDGPDTLWQWS